MVPGRRIAGLVLLAALGTAVGYLGARFTGSDTWYLAIPAAIGLGWLVVARPDQCTPLNDREGSPRRGRPD